MGKSKGKILVAVVLGAALEALAKSAGNLTVKANETHDAFVARAVEKVATLGDNDFNAMPKAAQDYFNKAAQAINDEKPIPVAPGSKFPAAEPAKAETNQEAASAPKDAGKGGDKGKGKKTAQKPATQAAKGKEKPAPKAKAAKGKKTAAAKPKAKSGPSLAERVRTMVIAKPDITVEEAAKRVSLPADHAGVYTLVTEAQEVLHLKKNAKDRAEALKSENSSHRIRAVVVSNPGIEFEAAMKKAGVKVTSKGPGPGSYPWNRWAGSSKVLEMVSAK